MTLVDYLNVMAYSESDLRRHAPLGSEEGKKGNRDLYTANMNAMCCYLDIPHVPFATGPLNSSEQEEESSPRKLGGRGQNGCPSTEGRR